VAASAAAAAWGSGGCRLTRCARHNWICTPAHAPALVGASSLCTSGSPLCPRLVPRPPHLLSTAPRCSCASWITSPILGALLSCFCFWLLRTLVLRHDNAYQRAFYVLVSIMVALAESLIEHVQLLGTLVGTELRLAAHWRPAVAAISLLRMACLHAPSASLTARGRCPVSSTVRDCCISLPHCPPQPLVAFIVAWFITVFTIKESTDRWDLHHMVRRCKSC